jgi:hypothetical protein
MDCGPNEAGRRLIWLFKPDWGAGYLRIWIAEKEPCLHQWRFLAIAFAPQFVAARDLRRFSQILCGVADLVL